MQRDRRNIVCLVWLVFLGWGGYAQSDKPESYLEVVGKAEYMMVPLNQAEVSLFKNGTHEKTVVTSRDGRFGFILELHRVYEIKVSKEGFISKKIVFNTEVPEGTTGKWLNEFAIGLLDPCEGVDYSLLEKPVDKVGYHERRNQFVSNRSYTNDLSGQMEQLVYEIEQCLYKKYDDLIQQADNLFDRKQYREARQQYMVATQADPYDRYPQKRIEEIDVLLRENQAQEEKYNSAVDLADNEYNRGNLKAAAGLYEQALKFKPADEYVNEQLREVYEKIETESQASRVTADKERLYNSLISQAEAAFHAKNFTVANQFYSEASELKPEESLPKQRLTVINNALDREKEAQQTGDMQRRYTSVVENADKWLQLGEYEQAREAYQKAAYMKPDERYAQAKLEEVNAVLAQRQQQKAQAKEIDTRYDEAIKTADQLLALQEYTHARETYRRAMVYKPGETYPKTKMDEIDATLEAIGKQQAEGRAQRAEYNRFITSADNAIETNQYNEAKANYERALQLFPDENYPKTQLVRVEQLMRENQNRAAAQTARKRQYDEVIRQADQYWTQGNLENAQTHYLQASKLLPNEPYPKERLALITTRLAEQEKEQIEKQRRKEQYEAAVQRADEFYRNKNYSAAKGEYQTALRYQPDEDYPKKRIRQIEDILKLLADSQSKKTSSNTNSSSKAVENEIKKLYFNNPSEKEMYIQSLKEKYPPGITKEVYKGEFRTMNRYIVIRSGQANEFREIIYNWGTELYHFDIQTTLLYFRQQVKRRDGEHFQEITK